MKRVPRGGLFLFCSSAMWGRVLLPSAACSVQSTILEAVMEQSGNTKPSVSWFSLDSFQNCTFLINYITCKLPSLWPVCSNTNRLRYQGGYFEHGLCWHICSFVCCSTQLLLKGSANAGHWTRDSCCMKWCMKVWAIWMKAGKGLETRREKTSV